MPEPLKKIMNACDLMILAAGLGTRLRPATLENPKPAIPLLGVPLGYYVLPYLQDLPIENAVVNTFYLPEKIHNLYKKIPDFHFHFSDETEFIKDSAGGLKQAEKYFSSSRPILAVNADEVFFTQDTSFLKKALDFHIKEKNAATLVVMDHPEAGKKFGGIWCDSTTVKDIGKDPDQIKIKSGFKPWHYIGLQILSADLLKSIPENKAVNIFYDILIHQLQNLKVQIFPIQCDWFEVGSLHDYFETNTTLEKKLSEKSQIYISHFEKLKKYPASELNDLTIKDR